MPTRQRFEIVHPRLHPEMDHIFVWSKAVGQECMEFSVRCTVEELREFFQRTMKEHPHLFQNEQT